MRRPVRQRPSQIQELPAPLSGMVQSTSVVNTPIDAAEYIENWIPTQRGMSPRGGIVRTAFVTDPVRSLFQYDIASTSTLFAATADAIYDITDFDAENAPAPEVSGQTGGYYSTVQIGTAGGEFLVAVNGQDPAQVFDGLTFSEATITGVDTSLFTHVWKFRNRLFFTERNTNRFWYLPIDSIGGEATSFNLAGTFQKGGSLLTGDTWSTDSGDGYDDRCVFVTNKGEVAVFEGNDPSSGDNWRLVGRYDISPPLGKNAKMRAGGDLLLATREGIIPLTQVISKDPAALSFDAVSRNIYPTWEEEARETPENVSILKWDEFGIALTFFPGSSRTLSVGLERGAWGLQTGGWTGNCAEVYGGGAFIGKDDGRIYRLNITGLDDGVPITSKYCHSFNDFGAPAAYKRAQMVRFAFFAEVEFDFRAEMAVDYQVDFGPAPGSSVAVNTTSLWNDGSEWDDGSQWRIGGLGPATSFTAKWRTVSNSGYALAPVLQITSGGTAPLAVEFVRLDMAYETGQVVV